MLKNYHPHIYFFGLLLLVVSLPLSIFLLSVAQLILIVNWALENNFVEKWERAKKHNSVFAFIIIYLIHITGMFYSSDWAYGLHDLKIKLPLVVLPFVIGTSRPLPFSKFKIILLAFCGAVLASSVISTGILFEWWGTPVMDVRDISIFISHIRLALMVNMVIFILPWLIPQYRYLFTKVGIVLVILWLILFLVLLKSLTGLIIFGILGAFFLLRWAIQSSNLIFRWFAVVGASMVVLIFAAYITHSIGRFYYVEKADPEGLEENTVNGNAYIHNIHSKDSENGNFTWVYVCDKELESVWKKRSKLDYKGLDLKGQELRYTIIRYLTSRGLRKDSSGLASLHNEDIRNIEMGMANHIYSWKFSLYPRIYQLLWEINQFRNGGNPSGHSFTQRIEYLATAIDIIKSDFWFGVGTGDVAKAFDEQYLMNNSKLIKRWRLRAHNQFVTFFLTFGVIGFIIIALAMAYPVIKEKKFKNYLMILFLITGFLSFINEDTLETHAGISFFAFFYAFFLYNSETE